MGVNIKVLEALYGDCIIISYGENKESFILIDGGIGKQCYRNLKEFFRYLQQNDLKLDLLVLTHIDSDHISGILNLFSESDFDFSRINRMWFNYGQDLDEELNIIREGDIEKILIHDESTQISWKQATTLEEQISKSGINKDIIVKKNDAYQINKAKIKILSPTVKVLKEFNNNWIKEERSDTKIAARTDYDNTVEELVIKRFHENISLANKSSIAFLFEYESFKALFLGDSSAVDVTDALINMGYSVTNPLPLDVCKISHHASSHNTSNELIQILDCKNYIISTHLTTTGRPSKECLSRIVCNSRKAVTFYCNYEIDITRVFTKKEIDTYDIKFITLKKEGIDLGEL